MPATAFPARLHVWYAPTGPAELRAEGATSAIAPTIPNMDEIARRYNAYAALVNACAWALVDGGLKPDTANLVVREMAAAGAASAMLLAAYPNALPAPATPTTPATESTPAK